MWNEKKPLNTAVILGVMAFSFIVFVLRRPDIVTHAQPWAEDGKIWMAGIYNNGFLSSLFLPQNGYYQTISRLTYGISMILGISNAALGANVIAILIRCFFIGFILSSRMKFAPLSYRLAAVIYFILMPNQEEGFVNITNIHWYLSMYLVAVVMSEDSHGIAWKTHDYALLVISALSGPFVVFIAPCLLLKRVCERGGIANAIKGVNTFDAVMAICCVIQVAAILLSPDTARSSAPLGASVGILVKIVAYRIVAGSFFNNELIAFMPYEKWVCLALFIAFIVPALYFFVKSGWRFKVALIFPVLMIGFALAKPMMSVTDPQWPVFFGPINGQRYFFVTNFAFYCFVLFLFSRINCKSKLIVSVFSLVTIAILLPSFSIAPMPESGFKEDIEKFNDMDSGSKMDIRINPPGWTMQLIKK
ncbi:glucosyl transferase [Candidatus Pantoea deserta]|uniref:Glucosyl transferase n=2 Tax=Candidatus Pantoea deserta TaxID=1869313 RepID=A0A3N4P7E3_9GAMM|nr:glucosyl transferase [Pantoea deserta]